jgi:SNF2 family DNA or RNA helicase
VETLGKRWPFRLVAADESTKLKGFRLRKGGKRAAALSKIARKTVRWVNLTGTPAPNGLLDLWGQNWFVDFGQRLGHTFTAFKQRWFEEDIYAHTITPYAHSRDEIINAIADVTISLEAKDWFDCDDPVMRPVYVDLPGQTRAVYRQMEDEYFAELDGGASVEAVNAMTKLGKLMQITSGAIYTDKKCTQWAHIHDAKLDALAQILDELDGQPLLLSYFWRHSAERILKRFPRVARAYKDKRDENDWNAGRIKLMLAHPQSVGHGMNWQDGGCNICYFDQTWNLEHRQQILERIGPVRQMQAGHPRPVNVWDILARGTKDEDCMDRIQGKATLQQALRGARRARAA